MSDFPFEEGDAVLVRARENGDSGAIQVKFTAKCREICNWGPNQSPEARFKLPFGVMNSVTIRPYEAEFEVVSDD